MKNKKFLLYALLLVILGVACGNALVWLGFAGKRELMRRQPVYFTRGLAYHVGSIKEKTGAWPDREQASEWLGDQWVGRVPEVRGAQLETYDSAECIYGSVTFRKGDFPAVSFAVCSEKDRPTSSTTWVWATDIYGEIVGNPPRASELRRILSDDPESTRGNGGVSLPSAQR